MSRRQRQEQRKQESAAATDYARSHIRERLKERTAPFRQELRAELEDEIKSIHRHFDELEQKLSQQLKQLQNKQDDVSRRYWQERKQLEKLQEEAEEERKRQQAKGNSSKDLRNQINQLKRNKTDVESVLWSAREGLSQPNGRMPLEKWILQQEARIRNLDKKLSAKQAQMRAVWGETLVQYKARVAQRDRQIQQLQSVVHGLNEEWQTEEPNRKELQNQLDNIAGEKSTEIKEMREAIKKDPGWREGYEAGIV